MAKNISSDAKYLYYRCSFSIFIGRKLLENKQYNHSIGRLFNRVTRKVSYQSNGVAKI
jgi:hypothetical protein